MFRFIIAQEALLGVNILGVNISLSYPGQHYAGFSTNININHVKKMSLQLTFDRSPDFRPPYMTISFRQVEKKKMFFKKTMVWVADVHLEHFSNITDNQSDFVADVSLLKSKYENFLIVQPEKGHPLHLICRNWKFKLQFNEETQFENVLKTLGIALDVKIKK